MPVPGQEGTGNALANMVQTIEIPITKKTSKISKALSFLDTQVIKRCWIAARKSAAIQPRYDSRHFELSYYSH
jgi:hypothetical protein